MELYDAITTTRAIRRYRDEPIPEEDLARILFAASRAPSGSNRQPFRFVVLRDGPAATEARSLLGSSFRALWSAKRAGDGYDAGSGTDRSSPKARMAATMQGFVDGFEAIPVIVLVCVEHWREPHWTAGASVYPACQNLLLAARDLGYGGVMTIWHLGVHDELRAVLGVPDGVDVAATIPLGRPTGHHGPVRRLPLHQLVHEDRWGGPAAWAQDPPDTRAVAPRRQPPITGSSDKHVR